MNILAQKLQLYKPQLSPGAFQLLSAHIQEIQQAEISPFLDQVFTSGSKFDESQMRSTLIKLTTRVTDFDPLTTTTIYNVSSFSTKFEFNAELKMRLKTASSNFNIVMNAKQHLNRELKNQWDLSPVNSELYQRVFESLIQGLSQLLTAENNPGQMCTVIAQLSNGQLSDLTTTLPMKESCNFSTPKAFLASQSLVIVTGEWKEQNFVTYNLAQPLVCPVAKLLKYKIPVQEQSGFFIVNNLKMMRNLKKLQLQVEKYKPAFVVFVNNYFVSKNNIAEIGDYKFPPLQSTSILSINEIAQKIETKCYFVAGQTNSVCNQNHFEQIPFNFKDQIGNNCEIVSNPNVIEFGNSRILIQTKQLQRQIQNESYNTPENCIQSYYMSYLSQNITCPCQSNCIYNREMPQVDCIATFEDFQAHRDNIMGMEVINVPDFEFGVAYVRGMRGDVVIDFILPE
ncbi:Conserved_hypothetical protein [Hexamita inflata]|uniref:Uncharacterized protein n=1 Tax=Hexamita inflata TaxID=28002 RepID=A0AA86NSE3_9EUKA|nr:Conserved hypothetical protein [Hexamita inflata]